jgi:hypothetical protein
VNRILEGFRNIMGALHSRNPKRIAVKSNAEHEQLDFPRTEHATKSGKVSSSFYIATIRENADGISCPLTGPDNSGLDLDDWVLGRSCSGKNRPGVSRSSSKILKCPPSPACSTASSISAFLHDEVPSVKNGIFSYSRSIFWSSQDRAEDRDTCEEQARRELLAARVLEKLVAAERAKEPVASPACGALSTGILVSSSTARPSRESANEALMAVIALPAMLLRRAVHTPRFRKVAVVGASE